jgi:hypothetical protein
MPKGFNDVDIDRPDDLLSAARQPCCAVQAAVTCVCGQVRGGWHGISVCTLVHRCIQLGNNQVSKVNGVFAAGGGVHATLRHNACPGVVVESRPGQGLQTPNLKSTTSPSRTHACM